MQEKVCTKCLQILPIQDFVKRKSSRDGYRNECKTCNNKYHRKRLADSTEKRESEKLRLKEIRKSWTLEKWEDYREQCRQYAKNNRHILLKNAGIRRARLLAATPSWSGCELESFAIEEIYHLSKLREKSLNLRMNVDHIVPLSSDYVCGLHCASNLQIVSEKYNKSKNNRYWPDMPIIDEELKVMIYKFKTEK